MFRPLAFTKTFAMAAASLLSVTLVPVAMGLFVKGRMYRESANPLNRLLVRWYRPLIDAVLRYRWGVLTAAAATVILSWIPWARIGSEFMPPVEEGTILYMPQTLPGLGIGRARDLLTMQDSILRSFPEVERVWGKAGRAETATDPAGLDMFETTITLKPESEWRPGVGMDSLVAEMDAALRIPGVTNAWTMPIKGRIDMLATGIRTPVGVKVFGPDLAVLEGLARDVESALQALPGTRSVFAERAVGGSYVDIALDREAAARYGLNVTDIQDVIAAAIGGMVITETVEGRERYGVRLRYPQELRETPEQLADVLLPVMSSPVAMGGGAGGMGGGDMSAAAAGAGAQIPLGMVADIQLRPGPMVVRTEGAIPTAWVFVDVAGRDIGSYVEQAQRAVREQVVMPPGYSLRWSGQYEYLERARRTMRVVIPVTLAIIVLLLYLNFRSVGETLLVLLSLPFALVGGLWFVYALGYNWSVAVAIGFIALAGVAAETGVVMVLYLDQAWQAQRAKAGDGSAPDASDLYAAVIDGAVERVRPKLMTVTAIMAGLIPIMWSSGSGASVMKRIAAPMVGGMVSSTLLTLLVIPAAYSLWREWGLRRG